MKEVNFIQKQIEMLVEEMRPEEDFRNQIDIGHTFDGRNLILFEIRPSYVEEGEIVHVEFAKATYIGTKKLWKLFWMRASGKWQGYEPHLFSPSIHEIFEVVDEDKFHCFKG